MPVKRLYNKMADNQVDVDVTVKRIVFGEAPDRDCSTSRLEV